MSTETLSQPNPPAPGAASGPATPSIDGSVVSNAAAPQAKAAPQVAAPSVPNGPSHPGPAETETLNPAEIDARRARQLLDRALALSDKGDKAGAVLACRQAIGLAPNLASGYAMLAPLLERSGDTAGAMAAYEKVLSIAPRSPVERDSLARLRAAAKSPQSARASGLFHFDEGELFRDTAASAEPAPARPAAAAAKAQPAPAPATAGSHPNVPATAPATVAGATASASAAQPAARPARTRPASVSRASFSVPSIAATPTPSPLAATVTDTEDVPVVIPHWVRALRGESSFWMQSAPLVVMALASLGFLLWARNVAASRVEPPAISMAPSEPAGSDIVNPMPQEPGMRTPSTSPNNPNATGIPITNARNAPPAPATPVNGNVPAPDAGNEAPPTTAGGRSARNTSTRVTQLPDQTPAVAPADPSPFGGMRQVRVTPPVQPEPTVRAVVPTPPPPAGAGSPGGSSVGGSPVNPAGSGTRGYIRITGSRGANPPVRSEVRSRTSEERALEDARAGRIGNAISGTSSSIESGRDTGWRYQQRALLFLEQGDNGRAADDFKIAIAAYKDQIGRNVNTEQARVGIEACQNGLRLAQLRMR